MDNEWMEIDTPRAHKYSCGWCDSSVASSIGYEAEGAIDGRRGWIYICPHCVKPTFFHGSTQYPESRPGNAVEHLEKDIEALYNEVRNCVAASAYTAAVLLCRKLLMNIAIAQGANEGLQFIKYVDFLADQGFVPPNGRGWVDHIRKKGNEANHEIVMMSRGDAIELLAFSEMLLKFIFEFPAKVPTTSEQRAQQA